MDTLKEKRSKLRSFEKETDVHEFLYHLLPKLGFSDTRITHEAGNQPEYGKDLIASMHDQLEDRKEWSAFVVKNGKVSGSTGKVKDIADQVYEAFEHEYVNSVARLRVKMNKVKVVVTGNIAAGAKEKVKKANKLQSPNIAFWDEDKLIEFIDKVWPEWWLGGSVHYQNYVKSFIARIDDLNIVHSVSSKPGIAGDFIQNYISLNVQERVIDADGKVKWKSRTSDSLSDFEDDLVIVGSAGTGKTTLLAKLCKSIVEGNSLRNSEEFYPMLLSFTRIKQSGYSVQKAIRSSFDEGWASSFKLDLDSILSKGACVLFIDALDELPKEADKRLALKCIADFKLKFPDVRIVVSSRPADFLLEECDQIGFNYVEIGMLNLNQVKQYVDNYFGESSLKSGALLKTISTSSIFDRLPKTPLTVTLMTLIFEEEGVEVPATISDLYLLFCEQVLGRFYTANRAELIDYNVRFRVISEIAFKMHINRIKSISRSELFGIINGYASDRDQKINPQLFTEDLIKNTNLIVEKRNGQYEFQHLSFQEFFTAYAIHNFSRDHKGFMFSEFYNLWWQNVAIFYGGLVKDSVATIETVIDCDVPTNASSKLSYSLGLGLLLQTLYNTRTDVRSKGVMSSVDAISWTLDRIVNLNHPTTPDLVYFRTVSEYTVQNIIPQVFAYHHSGVTLESVLIEVAEQLWSKLTEKEVERTVLNKFYIIALTLSIDDYRKYKYLGSLKDFSRDLSDAQIAYLDDINRRIRRVNNKSGEFKSELRIIDRFVNKELERRKLDIDKINMPIKSAQID